MRRLLIGLVAAGTFQLCLPETRAQSCVGDCNGDGQATVDEIVRMVNIALGARSVDSCPGVERWCNPDLPPPITCIVAAVNNALNDCPAVLPSPTPTCVPVPALMPTFTFALNPSVPRIDERARLSIRISGGAPNGIYNLLDSSGLVDVMGPTYTSPLGSEVDFNLTATRSGTTSVVLTVFYTLDLASPIYCYASRYQYVQSDPFPVTVSSTRVPTPTPTPCACTPTRTNTPSTPTRTSTPSLAESSAAAPVPWIAQPSTSTNLLRRHSARAASSNL